MFLQWQPVYSSVIAEGRGHGTRESCPPLSQCRALPLLLCRSRGSRGSCNSSHNSGSFPNLWGVRLGGNFKNWCSKLEAQKQQGERFLLSLRLEVLFLVFNWILSWFSVCSVLFSSLPRPPCYHLTIPCCAHLCSAQQAHMLFYLLRQALQLLFNIIFSSLFNSEKTTSFLSRNKYKLGTRSETTDYENTGRKYMI